MKGRFRQLGLIPTGEFCEKGRPFATQSVFCGLASLTSLGICQKCTLRSTQSYSVRICMLIDKVPRQFTYDKV